MACYLHGAIEEDNCKPQQISGRTFETECETEVVQNQTRRSVFTLKLQTVGLRWS